MLERSVLLNWSLQLFIEPLNAYCSFSIAEQHAFCVLEAFNDSWIIDCYCGWRLVKVICIVTFISHASHSLRIHRWNRFGVLASHPSLLWQQLSVCCPDLLFARGMVAICWRRQNPSVPVFQTARYVCVCARFFFFFAFTRVHVFMQAASISSLIGSENRKWHMCLSEGLWSQVWIGTFRNM